MNRIEDRLAEEGLVYQEFGGVHPNPLMSHAQQGAVQAAAFQADFILAVGGGSSIDEAKAIAHGAANPETTIEAICDKEVPGEEESSDRSGAYDCCGRQ